MKFKTMKIRTASIMISKESSESKTLDDVYKFTYPEVKMEFKVSQADTDKPDACMFKIYGVSKETYKLFKIPKKGKYNKNQRVEITFGYDRDESLVYSGIIDRVIYSFENGSQILTVLINKDMNKFINMSSSISTKEKVTLGTALDLICKAYSYDILLEKSVNKTISVGKLSYSGNVEGALKSVLSKRYNYYIDQDFIRVFSLNSSVYREIVLSMDNGLLKYPTEDSKGKKVSIKSVLIPSLEAGVVIKIPVDDDWFASTDTGVYRSFTIGRYSTSFSNGLGVSEMECEENAE